MESNALLMVLGMQCLSFVNVYGDFFSNLDKMDLDSQLLEIDKMMKTIDNDEDEAMEKLGAKSKDAADDDDFDLNDSLGALSGLLGGGQCTYKCKNGQKPKPRKGHKPTSNGCGSFGLQVEVLDVPGVGKCCDKHDMCYDTCNNNRKQCDDDFKKCLMDVCRKTKKSKIDPKECKAGAELMHMGAATFGCQAYTDAQEAACTCSIVDTKTTKPSKDKKEKSNDDRIDRSLPKNKDSANIKANKKLNKPKDKMQSKNTDKTNDKDKSQKNSNSGKRKLDKNNPKDEL